jgi:2-polyprenyl-6-methoxyphenol hydroxylase-like FAD-dependent oxidoreductase
MIIIIGAGFSGLGVAVVMGKQGFNVTLPEKNKPRSTDEFTCMRKGDLPSTRLTFIGLSVQSMFVL